MTLLDKLIKQQQEEYHRKLYVYFRKEARKSKLSPQAFKDKLDELGAAGYRQIPVTTVRKYWKPKTFSLAKIEKNNQVSLIYFDGKEFHQCLTSCKDD